MCFNINIYFEHTKITEIPLHIHFLIIISIQISGLTIKEENIYALYICIFVYFTALNISKQFERGIKTNVPPDWNPACKTN